jgi:hypothetical protein
MSSGVKDNIQPATYLDGWLFFFLVGLYHARMPNHMTFLVGTSDTITNYFRYLCIITDLYRKYVSKQPKLGSNAVYFGGKYCLHIQGRRMSQARNQQEFAAS